MSDDKVYTFFATAPKGLELLLADELRALGAASAAEKRAGTVFTGTFTIAYKACLWSRLANRILWPFATFSANDPQELYDGVAKIPWQEHFGVNNTFAIDVSIRQANFKHSQFVAQKVKDAIVDQFRAQYGERPSVELHKPDVRINVYLHRDQATISIDLAGESLHKRGYRIQSGEAPLKENLAAAMLLRAGWPTIAKLGGTLLDPLAGSGTLVLEAALIAGDIAPGLTRNYFGFLAWRKYHAPLWQSLLRDALARKEAGLQKLPLLIGFDAEPEMINAATANAKQIGIGDYVHFEKRELAHCKQPEGAVAGLVISNPPYGERLGDKINLAELYQHLGHILKSHFANWKASILVSDIDFGKRLGIRACRKYAFYNGALVCTLLNFEITPAWFIDQHRVQNNKNTSSIAEVEEEQAGISMFVNRLRKNLKHLQRWAKVNKISCYRLYDADLPEYAVAIDYYEKFLHVQEYQAPKTIDPAKAQARLLAIKKVLPEVIGMPAECVFFKVRQRQRGDNQYQKQAEIGQFHEIHENNAKFLVNFTDYLDTGLFLDQRITRLLICDLAKDKHFLNLFAYTGTATVMAALGGAISTTTVDLSNVYLTWARRNLALNGFSERKHRFIQADCLAWFKEEQQKYDLIYLDPPTFSNSKRMQTTLDIQRDHVEIILQTVNLLAPKGVLIFATNKRKFKLNTDALSHLKIEDFTKQTLPEDFKRNPHIHVCWKISV